MTTEAGFRRFSFPDGVLALVCLLHDDSTSELDLAGLSAGELERAERYRVEQKRRQFLFTRSAGRQVLARHFHVPASEIEWNVAGPPEVRLGGSRIEESISCSHSGSVSALAIGRAGLLIGIDLDQFDHSLSPGPLAEVALTEFERRKWTLLPQEQQTPFLLRSWTVKEALLKTLRRGVVPAPQSIQLHWREEEQEEHRTPSVPGNSLAGGGKLHLSHVEWLDPKISSAFCVRNFLLETKADRKRMCGVGWMGNFAKRKDSVKMDCGCESLAIALFGAVSPGEPCADLAGLSPVQKLKISKIRTEEFNFAGKASFLTDVFNVTIAAPLEADAVDAE